MPYEELPHTADWSIRVEARDLAGLFVEAALAMNDLAGAQLGSAQRRETVFETAAQDAESLLVAFLSELVYYAENERTAFDRFQARVDRQQGGWTLSARMSGAPLASLGKAIKAVTFHDLKIRPSPQGYSVVIVFDV
ncbi:MAG: archease [Chloroflexi bacterium]|nr:archease [Chloroflexota bacterium]